MNCNRNGFASIFFQNHPLDIFDIIAEFVDYQNKDSKIEIAFFSLARTTVNFQTALTFLTLTKENLTWYLIDFIYIKL